MSQLFPTTGSERRYTLSKYMGSSTLVEHSAGESNAHIHSKRRKHKHKKHKKHRRDKIRSRSRSENCSSRTNLIYDNEAVLDNVTSDCRSSGDHLKKGKNEFSGPLEEMPDFTWLTKEFKFSDITDTFGGDGAVSNLNTDITYPESDLSQRAAPPANVQGMHYESTSKLNERALIEQEIQDKYAEMDVLIEKMHSKRHRSKRRRKYHFRKYDSTEPGPWISSSVNICPIKREKRCAQPIREALLVRTAMRKAWKGMLGSCCGKGCWATWKWVSLRGVISDYE